MNDDSDRLTRYRQAVDSLPAQSREIFLLHCLEELEYPEIAIRMGIPIIAVETALAMALIRIDLAVRIDREGD